LLPITTAEEIYNDNTNIFSDHIIITLTTHHSYLDKINMDEKKKKKKQQQQQNIHNTFMYSKTSEERPPV
jgi:hypothetical protein